MSKADFYQTLNAQVSAIIAGETDSIANMANISALLFDALDEVNWVGFYRCFDEELVLGPFQGKVACIRIPLGAGVCGTAAKTGEVQRIADVHQFSGHIACDAASNAEIVLPVRKEGKVVAVLDIDSTRFERFDADDQAGLEALVQTFESSLV
ncbi:GAF domain-containing protein [Thalassomonas actiniarum]|uniref:GAF domain-containing protein n=1 Tax=Thalassomonas actiniarum TaxID=485447 RepID=A0AAF0BXB2_9GAMM|nr:GAF domain-containing protein [Thalassomonas actiniarum]WDD96996.1 GAF domain-containing protein [Thalassomonas actiniarum]